MSLISPSPALSLFSGLFEQDAETKQLQQTMGLSTPHPSATTPHTFLVHSFTQTVFDILACVCVSLSLSLCVCAPSFFSNILPLFLHSKPGIVVANVSDAPPTGDMEDATEESLQINADSQLMLQELVDIFDELVHVNLEVRLKANELLTLINQPPGQQQQQQQAGEGEGESTYQYEQVKIE